MERLDRQIERMDRGARYGFWNTGVYLLAQSAEEARVGTSVLQGLFRGENSHLEPSHVNVWVRDDDRKRFQRALVALQHLQHPRVDATSLVTPELAKALGVEAFTATSMLASDELALVMGLPERSVPGVTVLHSAAFGRQVTRQRQRPGDVAVGLGRVRHMGQDEETPLELDVASLAMHALVTGSTGSGKTNVTLQLLRQLTRCSRRVPFLVIEPVKDEYRRLLSMKTAQGPVRHFGTGLRGASMLRLDPFRFPEGIHVFEHLDRLVQVFNAAFPMYAAMPALLEEGMRRVYERHGWNLAASCCLHDPPRYPSLVDLADELRDVVENSDYSERLKADYAGALVTRVRSLTRGIRGEMLCPLPGEVTPLEEVFDVPCVVNLMGLGSPETKSLVMGMLLTSLYEHRQCQMEEESRVEQVERDKLLHLTILEEAHHLLRRHGTEVQQESANLRGMSVEMFSNAIAEMRAWGEGFCVVDQSVTSLDLSAIKNTNTKIVMRTPFAEDRTLVGESINATDEQIDELGRLETGVGAVYQNDWLEPVLCSFTLCDLPRGGRPLPSSLRLSRNQLAILVGLALHPRLEDPAGAAGELLAPLERTVDAAMDELAASLGRPDLATRLRALFGPGREVAHAALVRDLLPGAEPTSAPGGDYLLLGELLRRFGLPHRGILRGLKAMDHDEVDPLGSLRAVFV